MLSHSSYDDVVIGAGHNGLTCAAYLARSGRRVLVLEERGLVGGFATTEETLAKAPGFKFSPTSLDIVAGNIPPSVIAELDLQRLGLRFVWPDPFYSYIAPDGSSIAFWRDPRRTCDEIARFSTADAQNYAALNEIFRDLWMTAAPYMMDHPLHPSWATRWKILSKALSRHRNLRKSLRILLSAPGPVLEEWFESPQLKAALGCFAIGGVVAVDEPQSGLILSVMAMQHQWGVARPVGGMGAFTQALAGDVIAHGGEIRTGCRVDRLTMSAGRASGVVVRGGDEIRAAHVIGAIDPTTLFTKLLPDPHLPQLVRSELRGLGVLRNNASSFRADVALDRRPSFIVGAERAAELAPSVMLFAPDLSYVRRCTNLLSAGEIAAELPVWIGMPSAIDRSLVPSAHAGEGLYVFVPAVPARLRDAQPWAERKDALVRDVMGVLDGYAPGTSGTVIDAVAHSPEDLHLFSNVHAGHLFHADMTLAQMGPWRPTPSLAGYKSPVPGLWHTAAGAHPMGTINGWSGRSAARSLLRDH